MATARLEGRRAVVTGASGYTGLQLCRRLRGAGNPVSAIVRTSSNVAELEEAGVKCHAVELTDSAALRQVMDPETIVFHIAAAYRVEHTDPAEFTRVNVEGTRAVLDAAGLAGVHRVVHCSTVGVQGHIDDPPATEEYRLGPGDHYQRSKLEGERLALDSFGKGLPGAVVRPAAIYGPGERRFLKLFRAIAQGRFVMIGSGNTLYHLAYIDDLIDGFLLAAEHPAAVGEVFTIGGARHITLRELVRKIASVLGVSEPRWRAPLWPVMTTAAACEWVCGVLRVPPPLYRRRVEFFVKDRAFDISKARRLLGYEPRVDLDTGLRQTAESYRDLGWL